MESMGIRISRSMVESHGEGLLTVDNSPRGASFYLALLIKARCVNDARNRPHSIRRRRR
jgi:K+-sensing histidine kinase KdpD